MKYNYKVIGERICTERKKLGYSQLQLMAALNERGIPKGRNGISDIENGNAKRFECDFLFALCDIFDCELGYLLGEYDQKTGRETDICRETGLTPGAVQYLRELRSMGAFGVDVISAILETAPNETVGIIGAAIDARVMSRNNPGMAWEDRSTLEIGSMELNADSEDVIDSAISARIIKNMDGVANSYKRLFDRSPSERYWGNP